MIITILLNTSTCFSERLPRIWLEALADESLLALHIYIERHSRCNSSRLRQGMALVPHIIRSHTDEINLQARTAIFAI